MLRKVYDILSCNYVFLLQIQINEHFEVPLLMVEMKEIVYYSLLELNE